MKLYQLDHAGIVAASATPNTLLQLIMPSFGDNDTAVSPGDPLYDTVKEAFTGGQYIHVADIDHEDPSFAFRYTQHLDESWTAFPHPSVIPVQGMAARSTSVGDILEIDGRYMLVAGSGFKPLADGFPDRPSAQAS